MENQAFTANVSLTKTDLDTGAGLEGAEFTLYRKDAEGIYGEVVRQEADKDGKVSFTLTQSGSYKVVETKGAYGYDYHAKNPYTAEFSLTNTEEFQNSSLILADKVSEETAKKYGLIITGNLSEKTDSVTNKKTPEEDTGAITITKYLQLDGLISGLEMGAKEAVFYTALFTDPEGTRRYSEVKELHIKDGNSTSVTFEGLPEGTYYVFETQADGTVIPYEQLTKDSAGNQFYCTGTDITAIEISPQQKEKSAELYNWYLDLPDGYYLSGKLEITKNVIKAGKTITAEDTFYAGIFDASDELVSVVELVQNDTVSVEVKLGGEKNTEPITYTVKETDAQGNPVDDSFPYEVTVSGDGTVSKEKTTAKVEITNTVKEDPQPTVSPEPTDTPEPTVTPGTTSNIKTGDDTQHSHLYSC
ncbi:MAG: SpaA isopeptide-forming pilin-related protein [Blautia sp.]